MDWTAIEALPAAFAALREAVQGVRSLKSDQEVNTVRSELLEKLVSAHQATLELQILVHAARDRNEELEKENARLRGFEAVKPWDSIRSRSGKHLVQASTASRRKSRRPR